MPALRIAATNNHKVSKRVVTRDDGNYSIPRIFGIIFVVLALIVIMYFGARNVNRRRGRRLYNTRRNQGPVRVQRLEGHGGSRSGGGERLPTWSERFNHQRVSPVVEGEEINLPPPVYKRQDDMAVQRDPPPPYMGREGPS